MKTASELRAQTRATFKGHWGRAIVLSLIPMVCMGIVNQIIGKVTGPSFLINATADAPQVIFSNSFYSNELISLLVTMFFSVIFAGVIFKYIDWDNNRDLEFSAPQAAFNVFNYNIWTITKIYLWEFLFTTLWTLLFIVPGIVKGFSYSQAFNLYKIAEENGEADKYRAIDYITQSRQLMDGHKGSLFYLYLTFIGWLLLGIVSLGIGLLWVIPYMQGTRAAFFNDLMKNNK